MHSLGNELPNEAATLCSFDVRQWENLGGRMSTHMYLISGVTEPRGKGGCPVHCKSKVQSPLPRAPHPTTHIQPHHALHRWQEGEGEEEEDPAAAGDGDDFLLTDTGADLDLRLARLEALMQRRPELLSSVVLRQNPHNVHEWHKRAKLFAADPTKQILCYTEAVRTVDPDKVSWAWRRGEGMGEWNPFPPRCMCAGTSSPRSPWPSQLPEALPIHTHIPGGGEGAQPLGGFCQAVRTARRPRQRPLHIRQGGRG